MTPVGWMLASWLLSGLLMDLLVARGSRITGNRHGPVRSAICVLLGPIGLLLAAAYTLAAVCRRR